MILFHISNLENQPTLWAEQSPNEEFRENISKKQKSGKRKSRRFAYDAGEIGLKSLQKKIDETITLFKYTSTAIAWLPTMQDQVIPSSPLIAQTSVKKGKPHIAPWRVTIAGLTWENLTHLLCNHGEKDIVAQGVVQGNDVVFWREVMRFAGSLVAREHFLPGIQTIEKSFYARWQPVFLGADKELFSRLLKIMPPVVYALTGNKATAPPEIIPENILTNLIAGFVDPLVRSAAEDEIMIAPGAWRKKSDNFESLHDQWLHALQTSKSILQNEKKALAEFANQVAGWRQSIDRDSKSRFRLCFRLHEPDHSTSSESKEIKKSKEAWFVEYLLQPHDDRSLLLPVKEFWKTKNNALLKRIGNNAREYVLSSLGQASSLSRRIEESLKKPSPDGYSRHYWRS